MGTLASTAVLLMSEPETTYGEPITSPTWKWLGLVEDATVSGRAGATRFYGIGSYLPITMHPGNVEFSLSASLVSPGAEVLNAAAQRISGNRVRSYNMLAGPASSAWRYAGVKFDSITIDIPENGEPIRVSADLVARHIVTYDFNLSSVPSIPEPRLWVPSRLILQVDGQVVQDLLSASLTVRNNLERVYAAYDPSGEHNSRILRYLREGNREIELTIRNLAPALSPPPWVEEILHADCPPRVDASLSFTAYCEPSKYLSIVLEDGLYVEQGMELRANEYLEYPFRLEFADITIAESP